MNIEIITPEPIEDVVQITMTVKQAEALKLLCGRHEFSDMQRVHPDPDVYAAVSKVNAEIYSILTSKLGYRNEL